MYSGGGPGTFDLVFKNAAGKEPPFIVVECKGGSGTNSSSRAVVVEGAGTLRIQQGHPDYAKDVLAETIEDGDLVGWSAEDVTRLRDAVNNGDFKYVEVSQPINSDGSLGAVRAGRYDLDAGLPTAGP